MNAPAAAADRNLLFGILALQMDFISRDQLIAAMHAWVLAKARPLGPILVEQGALSPDDQSALDVLVTRHLARHGNDPEWSLAALGSAASARQELQAVADPEVQASLARAWATRAPTDYPDATPGGPVGEARREDPNATRPESVGARSTLDVRFRILRPHAQGGLGKVSVALDEELHREVALKEIQERHADDPNSRWRFLLEAEVTGQLEHPGIVPVYGLGQYADGRPFYAMRLIKGDSLKEAIERFHKADIPDRDPGERTLALRELLGHFIDVCNAIAYAHSRGILHRDIKPANIMLGKYGETLVLDWGLAKPVGHKEQSTTTEEPTLRPSGSGKAETVAGEAVGTPQYMSPEQAAGRLDLLGTASDVYSLGATLYSLLTGQPPFTDRDIGVVIQKVQRGAFSLPQLVKRSVPPALEAICLKAMALRAEDRYATPRALADDVEHWLADEPVAAHREPMGARLRRWGRRHRTLVTAAVVLLVTAVAALSSGLLLLGRKQTEVVQERNAARKARDQFEAISKFYEDHVLTAARPKGWAGGSGKGLTLKEALDQAAETIDKAFAGQPELEAAVRNTLGMTYYYLSQYEAAGLQLEKAHAIRLRVLGPDHADTLTSQHNLAMERWKQEKYAEAIELGRQTLERRRRVLGPEHEDTLFTQLNLGLFLSENGQYDQAEALLRPGVETCKRVLGPDHHHTLYGQSDLALVLNNKDKYEEAVALDRDTLDKRRRSLGSDHPDTLRSMGNLAYSLSNVGNLQEAEEMARQALQARRRVLGDEHEETFGSLGGLAYVLQRRGKLEEAEQLLRELVAACRRKYGPDFGQTLSGQNKLAWVLMRQGKLAEAETLFRQTLDSQRRVRGADNEATLMYQGDLAAVLGQQGKVTEAETLYRQTLDAQRRVLGPDNQNVLTTQYNLAWVLSRQEKLDKAEALFRQTLDAERRVLGPDIPDTLKTQNQLAYVLERQGKLDEAEALYRQTLDAQRRVLGPNNPDTLESQGDLARVLGHQSKRDDAEKLFREVLAGYRKTVGPDNLSLASTLADFGLHLTENGRLTEAEPLLRECLAIREKKLPPGHSQIANARSLLGGCLGGQKNFADAEPLLLSGCEGLTKAKGAPAKQVAKAFDRVIELYEKWGKPEQAEAWRKKRPPARK